MPDLSQQTPMHPADEPVRITDKRLGQRAEDIAATAAKLRDAVLAEEAASDASTPVEMNRADRIAELREIGSSRDLDKREQKELMRLQAEQQAADEEAAQNAPLEARTAFIVIIGHDGSAVASSDMDPNLVIDREATIDDYYAGCSLIQRDIQASLNAKHVVVGMMNSAAQTRAAMAARQPTGGLQVPGR